MLTAHQLALHAKTITHSSQSAPDESSEIDLLSETDGDSWHCLTDRIPASGELLLRPLGKELLSIFTSLFEITHHSVRQGVIKPVILQSEGLPPCQGALKRPWENLEVILNKVIEFEQSFDNV